MSNNPGEISERMAEKHGLAGLETSVDIERIKQILEDALCRRRIERFEESIASNLINLPETDPEDQR